MKIISFDNKWFLKNNDNTLTPFQTYFGAALNKDLSSNKYVAATPSNPNVFVVMSMVGAGLGDHFSIRVIKLSEDTDPVIVFYKIVDDDLAQKLRDNLSTFHPLSKILFSDHLEVPPSEIQNVIDFFQE